MLFDLDGTLYAIERFVASGFRAVAAAVDAEWGLPRALVLDVLTEASVRQRGRELQVVAERFQLGAGAAARLLDTYRAHVPELTLPELSVAVLRCLRPSWRLGVVTNGRPDIQARKVRALGLARLVDVVVYAADHGTGVGKPEAAPFLAACRQLDVTASSAVFVGDDPVCDMAGARTAGLRTVWLSPSPTAAARAAGVADLIASSLAEVPAAVSRLVAPDWRAHVA